MSMRPAGHANTLIRHGMVMLLFCPFVILALSGCTNGEAKVESSIPTDAAKFAQQFEFSLFSRPARTWEMLPQRYRTDVNSLIRDFADHVDPEVWNKSFAVLRRASKLLIDKQSFWIDEIPQDANRDFTKKVAPSFLKVLDDLLNSDLANHQIASTTFDLGVALQGPLGKSTADFCNRAYDEMKLAVRDRGFFRIGDPEDNVLIPRGDEIVDPREAVYAVQSSSGNQVMISSSNGRSEPIVQAWIQAEDRWVPASIDARWQAVMDLARGVLTGIPTTMLLNQNKSEILEALTLVDNAIELLEKAETPLQFQFGAVVAFAPIRKFGEQNFTLPLELEGIFDRDLPEPIGDQPAEAAGGKRLRVFEREPDIHHPDL